LNYLYGILEIPVNRDVALRCWRLALKTDPNYSRCNASLGHELLKDGAFLEAIPLLQRALPEMEYAGQVWLDLAEAQISIGDLGEAQRSLARAKSAKVAPNPSQMESLTKRLMQATSGRMMTTR
jgi:predicted Zn-dependent protease